jgi:hypothetical protein
MGARVYNPETNQFTSKDPVKGGNENSYTYPNDPINGSDFTGLWDGWDTLDLVLTVASFVPIPGLQQVAWVAKVIAAGSRAVKFAKTALTLSKSKNAIQAIEKIAPKAEGVYEFWVDGKKYIGQSNNIARRMQEHKRYWASQNKTITDLDFTVMKGSTSYERRYQEQILIRDNGGVFKDNEASILHNKINAMRKFP